MNILYIFLKWGVFVLKSKEKVGVLKSERKWINNI